jgi:hypothetical protein
MALTRMSASAANAAVERLIPQYTFTHTASATNATTTLTFTGSEATDIVPGDTVAGAGITVHNAIVTAVAAYGATVVVTIAAGTTAEGAGGTLGTLTTSSYTFTRNVNMSLHSADPVTTGASEISAGGNAYVRQSITFGTPSSGVKTSTNAQNFVNTPAIATLLGLGFWSGILGGTATTYLCGILLTTIAVPAGATVAVASAAVTITEAG